MAKAELLLVVFLLFQLGCEGFDFTLDSDPPGRSVASRARPVCSVLQCVESLAGGSGDSVNRTRTVTSIAVSIIRLDGSGTRIGQWRELASVTSQQPTLIRVSDGVKVTGRLSDLQASLTLEFTKDADCRDSQFSCVAVYADQRGQASVKKSLVGRAVGSGDHSPRTQPDNYPGLSQKVPVAGTDQGGVSALLLQQLVTSVQVKVDWVGSRLEDSINALERRLGDKLGQLEAAVGDRTDRLDSDMERRFGALETRVDHLEDRLEDRLTQLQDQVLQTVGKLQDSCPDTAGLCDQLDSRLTSLGDKLDTSTHRLDTCVAGVRSLNGSLGQGSDQCVATVDGRLTDLLSDLTSVSGATHALLSEVSAIRAGYGAGALLPVDEFSDPLDTGKSEWRLAFRGTAFNNVQVLPAYMHGTGIPRQVEAGCKQFNRSLACVNHYRNQQALDTWAGVDEVLFAIYSDGQLVKRVIFNGKGSTFTDWFAPDRVIMSSWVDLTTQPHNFFSIAGYHSRDCFRRFFMNMDYDRGCAGYRGWFKAAETMAECPDEINTLAIPRFSYAPGETLSLWSGAALADAFGIFLRYE